MGTEYWMRFGTKSQTSYFHIFLLKGQKPRKLNSWMKGWRILLRSDVSSLIFNLNLHVWRPATADQYKLLYKSENFISLENIGESTYLIPLTENLLLEPNDVIGISLDGLNPIAEFKNTLCSRGEVYSHSRKLVEVGDVLTFTKRDQCIDFVIHFDLLPGKFKN